MNNYNYHHKHLKEEKHPLIVKQYEEETNRATFTLEGDRYIKSVSREQ